MNPFLIGSAALVLVAYLKKKKDTPKELPKNSTELTNSNSWQGLSNTDAATRDILGGVGIVAGGISAAAVIANAAGLTLSEVASNISTAIQSVFSGIVVTGFGVFCILIAVMIIAIQIMKAILVPAKDFVEHMKQLLPNAEGLHRFEAGWIPRIAKANGITLVEGTKDQDHIYANKIVVDPRIETTVKNPDIGITRLGRRGVFNFQKERMHGVDPVELQRTLRGVSLTYILERARFGAAYLRFWGPKVGFKSDFKLADNDYWLNHMYDDLPGYEGDNLGGLNQVPLLGGYTEKPLDTEYSEISPSAAQLRGINTSPILNEASARWQVIAKFQAFYDALCVLNKDNAIYFPWYPERYANDVYERLELSNPLFVLRGTDIILQYSAWHFVDESGNPCHLYMNVISFKDGENKCIQVPCPNEKLS